MGFVKSGFEGMFISDGYALFFKIIFLIITFLTILISMGYTQGKDRIRGILCLDPFRHPRDDADGIRDSFDHHLPRAGDDVDLYLRLSWNDA